MLMEKLTDRNSAKDLPSTRVADPKIMRSTFGCFASGVTVVTCLNGNNPHGMTANSFISVSLQPARALISIKKSAKMHTVLQASEYFALSVLSENQSGIASHFAGRPQDGFKPIFDHISGVPVIPDAMAWMVCRRSHEVEIDDHKLFIGELIDCDHDETAAPLVFFGGRFATLADNLSTGSLSCTE